MLAAKGSSGETITFFVIGIVGIVVSAAVYLVPRMFDAVTRARLRMENRDEHDERTLERDRQRRRFIALVLGIGSTVILAQGLAKL